MPADIDLFLSDKPAAAKSGPAYADSEISSQQRILNSRMQRGSTVVVPGTMTVSMNWEPIIALREKIKATGDAFQPSVFTHFSLMPQPKSPRITLPCAPLFGEMTS